MPTQFTPRWANPYPQNGDVPSIPAHIQALGVALDDVAKDDQGVFAALPTSTPGAPGKRGRYYFATDTGQLFRDTGTSWVEIPIGDQPTAIMGKTVAQTFGAAALTGLTFNVTTVLNKMTYAAASGIFTATRAGLYLCSCSISPPAGTTVDLRIITGSGQLVAYETNQIAATIATINLSGIARMAANDTVLCQAKLSSAGDITGADFQAVRIAQYL